MPMKIVPPVVREEESTDKFDIGPLVLMSGFMTKRTRTLNRWKQRWWQVLDNGFLLYYKSDDRSKLLGQIDIARTCYDVRLGSERCQVEFPRAAPSCCCISFAVLKRIYYVYTPTAGEAKRWSHTISNMSRVINRKIVAGVVHRKAPDPPPNVSSSYHIKMTRVKMCGSCEDLSRMEYNVPVKSTKLASNLERTMATSIPDYLDKIEDDSESLDPRSWLDENSLQEQTQSQVHPQDIGLTNQASWAPEEESSPALANEQTFPPQDTELTNKASWALEEESSSALILETEPALSSVVKSESVVISLVETTPLDYVKKTSLTSFQRRNHFSSPASLLKEFENLENEEEKIKEMLSDLDGLLPRRHASVGEEPGTTKPTRMLRKSSSAGDLLQEGPSETSSTRAAKPTPKPRRGKAKVRSEERCSSLIRESGSQKNRKRSSRLKFSPPSTPPPPPPQAPNTRGDTEASNIGFTSPSVTRYRDSGPPLFTPPPPPSHSPPPQVLN